MKTTLNDYYTQWAAKQFGATYAKEISDILKKYAQYASRTKPELLDAKTYSIENYNEAERVTNDWNQLQKEAEAINNKIPDEYKNAYFQLVLHPVKAYANLPEFIYGYVARNKDFVY